MSKSNYIAFPKKASVENTEMKVIKRNGKTENISFDKILRRLKKIGKTNNIKINYTALTIRIIEQLYTKIPTKNIDELTAEQCASLISISPDYETLAIHIIVSNHHKNTNASFSETMEELYQYKDYHGKHSPLLSKSFIENVRSNSEELDKMCDYSRDFILSYFGFKTLEKSYLMHINRRIVERPQHMWMRVAVALHGNDIENVRKTYELMSQKKFTHATPTLFNAGTPRPQLSSCFLLAMDEDSIECIYDTITECANISKWAGGIGVACSKIRAKGSSIRGTNGRSNGIVPMLRVFNSTCLYIDQCVLPETYIYTSEGPCQIQNCCAGKTEILNLNGEMEKIEKVLEHSYEGEMIIIKSKLFIDDLQITPEHPVCIAVSNQNRRIDDEEDEINYEWIEAKDLRVGDKMVYHQPKLLNNNYNLNEIDISKDLSVNDYFMYGLLLADGGSMLNSDTYAQICIYKKYDELYHTVISYLENRCIKYEIIEEKFAIREWDKIFIRWNKTVNLPFRYTDVYNENGIKRIHPRWFKNTNEYLQEIIRGIILAYSVLKVDKYICYDNTSRELIEGMRYILIKMGILAGGYTMNTNELENIEIENESNYINCPKTFFIEIPQTKYICNLLYINTYTKNTPNTYIDESYQSKSPNILTAEISNIYYTNYSGTLYDLKMNKEHNYTIHNGIVHNGGGKRNGSFAIYLEPWHADIEDFLQMRKNHGDENLKARDLFYAVWMPDLFMKRVKENGNWTLMCPDECPGLCDVYGEEFETLYTKYETENKGRQIIKARDLWFQILDAQMETGTPYIVYKDAVNRKSNQKNIGTIKSSNLCVAPETKILTDKGYYEIKSLCGEKVNVWNGKEYSNVDIVKTGENQELIEVHTSDGCVLHCTPYHKFFIKLQQKQIVDNNLKDKILKKYNLKYKEGDAIHNNYIDNIIRKNTEEIVIVEASQLKNGDILQQCDFPTIHGENTMLYPYSVGNMCDIDCDNKKSFYVPINNNLNDKIEWFSGLCDSVGHINKEKTNKEKYLLSTIINNANLQLISYNKNFLIDVKMMLQTCGVNAEEYNYTQQESGLYSLLLSEYDVIHLKQLGFSPRKLNINIILNKENDIIISKKDDIELYNFNRTKNIKIEKIVYSGRKDDTYCFNEPLRHAGIFNGILTSQCSEITLFTNHEETAVCNLASIVLPAYVVPASGDTPVYFDYTELHRVAKIVAYNLNRVIDVNFYPNEKTRLSNMRHRPIGIGVQGLADVYMMMNLSFSSDYAKIINKNIFETIYHAAVESSMEIAQKEGPYETFIGSPASQGIFQFDMWNEETKNNEKNTENTETFNIMNSEPRYDWDILREKVKKYGIRNSMLLAPMPTASTSQIMGYNECFEPITSNIYSRRTLAGEFIVANKYLVNELISLGLWNEELKNNIIANNGSIQQISNLSVEIREKYKTVWELSMKTLINMAADRGQYICQSQSLNLWVENPSYSNLTAMHFYAFEKGLKTGIYYLRRRAAHKPQQFTITPEKSKHYEEPVCDVCSA